MQSSSLTLPVEPLIPDLAALKSWPYRVVLLTEMNLAVSQPEIK